MHKRTKACMIPKAVKEKVWERDGHRCVGCGRWVPVECACAHYIARSHGGLGIEENVLTLCPSCHAEYDQSARRRELKEIYGKYLETLYGANKRLVYKKGET